MIQAVNFVPHKQRDDAGDRVLKEKKHSELVLNQIFLYIKLTIGFFWMILSQRGIFDKHSVLLLESLS